MVILPSENCLVTLLFIYNRLRRGLFFFLSSSSFACRCFYLSQTSLALAAVQKRPLSIPERCSVVDARSCVARAERDVVGHLHDLLSWFSIVIVCCAAFSKAKIIKCPMILANILDPPACFCNLCVKTGGTYSLTGLRAIPVFLFTAATL